MILLDTNVFIYLSNGRINPSLIANFDIAYPSICKIEALGYHQLVAQEEARLRIIFNEARQLYLTDEIIDQSINLRQLKKISLGDSIVASTAISHNLPLWTANTEDFEHIPDLDLFDPLK